ncbi:MAG: GldG family protein [Methylovulum sp.]|nr:GldG family protein [Methylovulum sp.]
MNRLSLHKQRFKRGLVTLALVCAIGALAWLSTRYPLQTDITGNTANTLSVATQKLLLSLPEDVDITAYINKGQPIRLQIAQLVDRYRRHKTNVTLQFIDPATQPEQTRELELGAEGAVIVAYQGHTEKLKFVDESTLSNALLHLANANQRWISFLSGHGERSPVGVANFDLGQLGKELAGRNIKSLSINLATLPSIPDNSALLVIAAPAVPLLAGEQDIIKQYIQRGGNLLLLVEPGNPYLDTVLQQLGIRTLPGPIMDNSARLYGIDNPDFVLAGSYPAHAVTRGLQIITVYPVTAALDYRQTAGFHTEILLSTETGSITATNPPSKHGTLAFGLALSRDLGSATQQRIIVIGDSDFLSNTYLGNAGNLDMGLRIFNWLIHDDAFIDIPAKTATDKNLQLTQTAVAIIGFGFLIVIPLVLLLAGFVVWRRRKHR